MKVLKFIFLFIFKLTLSMGILCLLVSFSIKAFVKEGFTSVLVNSEETVEIFENIGIEKEKIREFVESDATQELISKYVNPVIDGTVDLENINIGNDILDFVKENQEMIEEAVGQPLPIEKIETYYSSENIEMINETYKDVAISVQEDMPVETREMVSSFSYLVSNEFRLAIFVLCVMSLLIVAFIQKSFYIWIRTLSNTLIWCGLLVGIVVSAGSLLITNIFNELIPGYSFDFSSGVTSSLVCFVSGIVGLIIYLIIKKLVNKNLVLKKAEETN